MTAQERAERFDLMYRDHYGAVLAYGRRRGARSPEDTAAEVYTVAWGKLGSVPQDALPWLLLATARKLLANERRKDARRASIPPLRPPAHATLEDPDLGSALAGLSRADREILLLTAWEGLSSEQLAATLGCSVGTARVRLHRARRRLAESLDTAPSEGEDRAPLLKTKDLM